MQENYLAKWLNNELSEEELAEFKNSDEYASYARIVAASEDFRAPDFNEAEALAAVKNKQLFEQSKVVQLNPFKRFMKVAAVIVVLIAGSYFFFNSLNATITTQYAETKEVILPDNSEVILNADSKLTYNKTDWDTNRNLNLNGEAFFKVAKGEKFTVATTLGTVAVLGTQFNVENRGDFFEVTCYEGLVSVVYNKNEIKLPAGASFVVINGAINNAQKPDALVPSWLNSESSFKSVPLKYVFDEFQRQHNIIVSTENIDMNQLYTGSFSNSDAKLALQSISAPSQIKFKLEGAKVLFYAEN